MKKFTTLILTVVVLVSACFTCVVAADNISKFSSKFKKNFRDCDKYEETVESEYQGESFTIKRSIQGWRNGFCKYEETLVSKDRGYKLNCSFSNIQVDELYEAMTSRSKAVEKYELDLFHEVQDPKTGKVRYVSNGTTSIKGDKAYISWAKYQNNPFFCKPEKIK